MTNLLYELLRLVSQLISIYSFVIVIWALMSWFPGASQSKLGQLVNSVVVPFVRMFNFIPPIGGLSFAPLVAIVVLQLAQYGVAELVSIVASAAI